jgi:hypothetical protein
MATKWRQLTKTQQDDGRRLAERAWRVGVDVTVTRAATEYDDTLRAVEAAESERA